MILKIFRTVAFNTSSSDLGSEQVFRVIETTFRNLVPEIGPDSAPVDPYYRAKNDSE